MKIEIEVKKEEILSYLAEKLKEDRELLDAIAWAVAHSIIQQHQQKVEEYIKEIVETFNIQTIIRQEIQRTLQRMDLEGMVKKQVASLLRTAASQL